MSTLEKIYAVEFMEYTDVLNTTVSNATNDVQAFSDLANIEYITIGHEPFLVPERYLDIYRKYGKGFRSIHFVGNMEIGMVDS